MDIILKTGKYINAIRECEKTITCPFADDLLKNYEKYIL